MIQQPVHPRLRGELINRISSNGAVVGSSPLTRGTLRHDSAPLSAPRFIPAYAGNSRLAETSLAQKSVHPRLRGELNTSLTKVGNPVGSSPLTRGTQCLGLTWHRYLRFIPAYAGNSPVYSVPGLVDHGSSPLTRGTLHRLKISRMLRRFIPAYAGNSLKMVTTLH